MFLPGLYRQRRQMSAPHPTTPRTQNNTKKQHSQTHRTGTAHRTSPPPPPPPRQASNAALMLAEMGDAAGAEAEMRKVARRAPGSADMRIALAALLWRRGRDGEAEEQPATASASVELIMTERATRRLSLDISSAGANAAPWRCRTRWQECGSALARRRPASSAKTELAPGRHRRRGWIA